MKRLLLGIMELIVFSQFIPCLRVLLGKKSIIMLSYNVCCFPGFALIASSLHAAAHLCFTVHASPVIKPDYVSSCVSEREL